MFNTINQFISYKVIPVLTLDRYAPSVAPWNVSFLNWYYLKKAMINAAKQNIKGICLDIGAGNSPYKKYLNVARYISVDKKQTRAVNYQENQNDIDADAKDLPFDNDFADTVLLNQVLEHIDDYEKVLEEIHRVLKKGGKLIISAPFVYHIHSEPNDYFRFSEYGLRYLLQKHNFVIYQFSYLGYVGTALVSIWNGFIWQVWNANSFTKFLRNTFFLLPLFVIILLNNCMGMILDMFVNPKFCPNYFVVCEKRYE